MTPGDVEKLYSLLDQAVALFKRKPKLSSETITQDFGDATIDSNATSCIRIRLMPNAKGNEYAFAFPQNGLSVVISILPCTDNDGDSQIKKKPLVVHDDQTANHKTDIGTSEINSADKQADTPTPHKGNRSPMQPSPQQAFVEKIFENITWPNSQAMTLEQFSTLNEKHGYGNVPSLVDESVPFEAGMVIVKDNAIVIDTKEWTPPTGGNAGEFYVDLPLNKIKLSVFVFRPLEKLFRDIPVSESVKGAKKDDDTVTGDDVFPLIGASTRGPSHRNDPKKSREDDMSWYNDAETGTLCLVVADGAGSAQFSRMGSELAARCIVDSVKESVKESQLKRGCLDSEPGRKTVMGIIEKGVRKALDDMDNMADSMSPGVTRRDFATTLNVAILQESATEPNLINILSFAVGDGRVVWLGNDGKFKSLSSPDRGRFASETQFITSEGILPPKKNEYAPGHSFAKRFRFDSFSSGKIALMTDGVSETFATDVDFRTSIEPWLQSFSAESLLGWLKSLGNTNFDDKTIMLARLDLPQKQ